MSGEYRACRGCGGTSLAPADGPWGPFTCRHCGLKDYGEIVGEVPA